MNDTLPVMPSVLAVCAHPDDESFGLGAILAALGDAGSRLSVLCFTHGEASTLHGDGVELAVVRADELAAASRILGVTDVELLHYADGHLDARSPDQLVHHINRAARRTGASALLVFDSGGITGHPDHRRATDAALRAAPLLGLPILAWAIPDKVAQLLNDEFKTTFVGRPDDQLDITISVDRTRQLEAIRSHRSQSADNPGECPLEWWDLRAEVR